MKNSLKRQLNRVSRKRKQRVHQLENAKIDRITSRVENFHNSARAFAAIKELKYTTPHQEVVVHDAKGEPIRDTALAAEAIAAHFQEQFARPDENPIEAFEGPPRPLLNIITVEEIEEVLKRLKNRKAVGPDDLPIECLKAAGRS